MNKLSHKRLVRIGSKYLRERMGCVVVVTELATRAGEQPDVLGWMHDGRSVLLECKASRSDFRADGKKMQRRAPTIGVGCERYYLAPAGLLKVDDLPLGWGLLEYTGRYVKRTVTAHGTDPNRRAEVQILISALRRMGRTGVRGINVRAYTYESGTEHRGTVGVGEP